MTKILVVDDNATNRKLLVTWLGSEGYLTLEAADGSDGLAAAARERPNLVVSDILMPTMDGYEFIRRLRTEPGFEQLPVIFYTADYHQQEARGLAAKLGVQRVLVKPAGRAEFLQAVEESLAPASAPPESPARLDQQFDIEHLRLITDKLSQKAEELRRANARLSALTSLNVQLASERDPAELLQQVCIGARNLLGASYAVLAVEQKVPGRTLIQCHSGIELPAGSAPQLSLAGGLLGQVFAEHRVHRLARSNGQPLDAGLPPAYPAPHSLLAVPISSLTRTYGWLCLADKVGASAFTAEDEYLLSILGAQVGRVYENGALYHDVLRLNRVYAMLSGINSLLVRVGDREQLLREACRIAVEQGGFKAAWCGLTETIAPGAQSSVAGDWPPAVADPVRSGQIDLKEYPIIAQAIRTRAPVVLNELAEQSSQYPLAQALAAHGARALAALPLVVAGEGVGCLLLASAEPAVFDRAEMRLLDELSADISFALDHLDKGERLNYLAYYDALTGLANRTFLLERLAQHIRAADSDGLFALLMVDIEDFEWLNDSLGRPGGDEVLREFAERLVHSAGDAAYVARCGADEFAVIIPRPENLMDVTRTVERWLTEWTSAPRGGAGPLPIRLKAGVALFPNDARDAAALLRGAETALKNAKQTQTAYALYTPQLSRTLQERRALDSSLRHALENDELTLYYQPKVELDSRRLVGLEALMRWRHPQRGLVMPATFIPLMEETGLIIEAGVWALRQASADRARWLAAALPAPRVAVNVSSAQLRRSDFVSSVAGALATTQPNGGIDIEVTESLLMKDVADNIEKLSRIRELGVGIALDDFGTGYSSLQYLARLPVESIKIDRSFVEAMLDDPSAMTLVSTVISLAHTLRLTTVAEGVESEEQAKILRLLHCDQMQGYLVSHPLSFEDMGNYLRGSAP